MNSMKTYDELIRELSDQSSISVREIQDILDEIIKNLKPIIENTIESMEIIFHDLDLENMERTPEEIKKEIKHEKNPMRLKQLNKELNSSYIYWRKKKKRK